MREVTELARGEGFSIGEVRVSANVPDWIADEKHDQIRLIFVRRGTYRLRMADIDRVVDPTVVGQAGMSIPSRSWVGTTAGDVDLTQRALVARARRGADEFELSEHVSKLTQLMLGERAQAGAPSRTGRSIHTRQKIIDIARELLTENPATLRLTDLAVRVGTSQSYLSRAFHQETGDTLSKFRNRLRVRQVLERIEGGECDLARLAAELGFSDQPHLTRTIREEVGGSPTIVRRIFDGMHDATY